VTLDEYISSGIVETCVLGLANYEERSEFERMCAAHTEVRAAREAFEIALEKQMMQGAIQSPANLKGKIFAEIDIEKDQLPLPVTHLKHENRPLAQSQWWRWVAAASIILLTFSTILNFYLFNRYKEYNSRYAELLASQTQMASLNLSMETELRDYRSALKMIKDPDMAIVKMPEVPGSPAHGIMATIYWHTRSKDVYLLINNLPMPASDKQYQLWAIVDGKPVDAGVFDMNPGLSFVKMKNIQQAQAFAITMEKKGGSKIPTMEAMYVLGKVTG
jgi:anti-sigma-K factor RskA